MRATVMYSAGNVRVENVPDARIIKPTDALVTVTRACICGSDLWPYKSMEPSETGVVMGHEAVGVVESVGADVRTVTKGDLVVMPRRQRNVQRFRLPAPADAEGLRGDRKSQRPAEEVVEGRRAPGSDPSVGDITYYAPWGNLAVFYKDFGYSSGRVKLGKIDSGVEALNRPGARTAWHAHPAGQTLIVTAGSGLVQQWGGRIQEIRPGDVVWIPPGQKHWHGAAPTTGMTHIAIQEHVNGKVVEWMEKVSDEQYSSKRSQP